MKWQPVVLLLINDERLECKCGNLAAFVTGRVVKDEYNSLEEVDVWCQECFMKSIEENTP